MAQPATAGGGGLTPPPQPQLQSNNDADKLEQSPQDSVPNHPPTITETLQSRSQQPPPCPADTIANLRTLSAALSAFQRCFNELQGHISSIQTAIDSIVPPEAAIVAPQLLPIVPVNQASSSAPIEENQSKPTGSELEHLCRTMNSRGLRKYMATHLSEISKLREEVPKALELAPNPARLALDCSGRFFLQGSKAFVDKKSPMIPAREASVLILECFLMMGIDLGIGIENAVKEEAEQAAVAWRKRLIAEGGLGKACKMDGRGLLLLIGCFGIPGAFKYEDFRDLFRTSNAKEIKFALRKSSFLIAKIPEVINWMVKNKMEVDAVDIAYTFGIEDQFNPQKLLISFLRESKDSSSKTKKAAQGSPAALNESNKKRLSGLRSIVKCLEGHKVDHTKLLPGWQINEMIAGLEKEIADLNKKTSEKSIQKRKGDETESSKKFKNQNQVKRSRLDGIQSHHAHSYYAPPSLYMLGPESMVGSVAGSAGGVLIGGPGLGVSADTNAGLHTGPCSRVHHGGVAVDHADMINHNGHMYRLRSDTALYDSYGTHSYSYMPSSSLESSTVLRTAAAVGPTGRTATSDHYSDHFQYHPEGVVETDVYHSNGVRTVGGVPGAVAPSHHSSYML